MGIILLLTGVIVIIEMIVSVIRYKLSELSGCDILDGIVLSTRSNNNTVYVRYNIDGLECDSVINVDDITKYKEGMKCYVVINSDTFKQQGVLDKMTCKEKKKINLSENLGYYRMILYFILMLLFYYFTVVGRG